MKRKIIIGSALALAIGLSGPANAMLFDTNGSAAGGALVNFDSLDWSPSSALAVGAVPITTGGTPFTLLAHSQLGNFVDAAGRNITSNGGLNTNYELTFVTGFGEIGTGLGISSASFAFDPTNQTNFFEVYWSSTVNADNSLDTDVGPKSAGTGFNDGTLIMSGVITDGYGAFTASTGPTSIKPLDSHNANSLSPTLSVSGAGGSTIAITVGSLQYDPNFFRDVLPGTQIFLDFNTLQNTPFKEVDPATVFTGAAGGGAPSVIPNIGPINGLPVTGASTDFEFQIDANQTQAYTPVPEPGTMILLGSGLFGLAGAARRRMKK